MTETLLWLSLVLQHTLLAFLAVSENLFLYTRVDPIDMVEGVCNGFLPYTRFLGFPEFSRYHQWQQESQ